MKQFRIGDIVQNKESKDITLDTYVVTMVNYTHYFTRRYYVDYNFKNPPEAIFMNGYMFNKETFEIDYRRIEG